MTIASAIAEIRSRRHVVVLSREPWAWRVLSTSGTYRHQLHWDHALKEVICDTCLSRHGRSNCWARRRCLEQLRAEWRKATTATVIHMEV
jgi:hypothetical protein